VEKSAAGKSVPIFLIMPLQLVSRKIKMKAKTLNMETPFIGMIFFIGCY
jgi:hypothetical protein